MNHSETCGTKTKQCHLDVLRSHLQRSLSAEESFGSSPPFHSSAERFLSPAPPPSEVTDTRITHHQRYWSSSYCNLSRPGVSNSHLFIMCNVVQSDRQQLVHRQRLLELQVYPYRTFHTQQQTESFIQSIQKERNTTQKQ